MIRLRILCFHALWGIIRLIMLCCWLGIRPLIGLLKILGGRSGGLMGLRILVGTGRIIKIVLLILGLRRFKSTVLLPIVINAQAHSLILAQYVKMVTTLYLMAL